MLQEIVWEISLALIIAIGLGWSFVLLRSQARQSDYAPLQSRAYRLRTRFFWLLVFALGTPMLLTLADLPYDAIRPAIAGGEPQVIEAKAFMWRWELSSDSVEANRPVVFRVMSEDVNHGFAVYDEKMKIVAQVQAMPGLTNVMQYTFREPGTYRVLCLEYCGLGHHNMAAEFTVLAAGVSANAEERS